MILIHVLGTHGLGICGARVDIHVAPHIKHDVSWTRLDVVVHETIFLCEISLGV